MVNELPKLPSAGACWLHVDMLAAANLHFAVIRLNRVNSDNGSGIVTVP